MTSEQIQALKEQAECVCGVLENIAGYEHGDIDGDDVELRFETEDGLDTGCTVSIVEQCQSAADVVRSLLAERAADKALIAELESRLNKPVLLPKTNGYWDEQEKAYEEAITLAKRQIRLAGFSVEDM